MDFTKSFLRGFEKRAYEGQPSGFKYDIPKGGLFGSLMRGEESAMKAPGAKRIRQMGAEKLTGAAMSRDPEETSKHLMRGEMGKGLSKKKKSAASKILAEGYKSGQV